MICLRIEDGREEMHWNGEWLKLESGMMSHSDSISISVEQMEANPFKNGQMDGKHSETGGMHATTCPLANIE
jgi:hypothetical protein